MVPYTKASMFVSTIGALNAAKRQTFVHQPRTWPKKKEEEEEEEEQAERPLGPGVRRAAEPTVGKKKDVDPLTELAKEVFGG